MYESIVALQWKYSTLHNEKRPFTFWTAFSKQFIPNGYQQEGKTPIKTNNKHIVDMPAN